MIFLTNPKLRLMRYYVIVFFVGLPLGLAALAFDHSLVLRTDIFIHLSVCIGLAVIGGLLIHFFFWEKCFAELHVCDSGVFWKCPCRKTIFLSFSECNYVGTDTEEAYNSPSFLFVYLSKTPYPQESKGKINRLHCSENFIKFWYSEELCRYLLSKDRERFSSLEKPTK